MVLPTLTFENKAEVAVIVLLFVRPSTVKVDVSPEATDPPSLNWNSVRGSPTRLVKVTAVPAVAEVISICFDVVLKEAVIVESSAVIALVN